MAERQRDAELLEAVGAMTIDFAALEFAVHTLAWVVMDDVLVGRAVTEPLTFDRLVELLARLVRRGLPADDRTRDRIRELLPRLRDVNGRRNGFTHALVGWIEGEARFLRIRGFVRGEPQLKAAEPAEVFGLAEECRKLSDEVEQTWQELRERRTPKLSTDV